MERGVGFFGILFLLSLAYLFSENRKKQNLKLICVGLLSQFILAIIVMGIPSLRIEGPLRFIFEFANSFILSLLEFTKEGGRFVFGNLLDESKSGFIFAFQVLPTIIFVSSLMSVLYYVGFMQLIIKFISKIMKRILGTSGAETMSVAANIFVGQTEAPLIIRPFLKKMTRSELFVVMVGGMATVAGGVMAAYVGLLKDRIPDIAGHLLTASLLSAPAAIVLAKIMIPETEKPETQGHLPDELSLPDYTNIIEAAAGGAADGMKLALNVGAMLLAFIALMACIDYVFIYLGELIRFSEWGSNWVPELILKINPEVKLTLSLIMGWIFSPVAYLLGIPWSEANIAGSLIGQKIVLNEFVAYLNLSQIGEQLSERTVIILSYALCGFANFSSIAIQIGGIGGMAPTRVKDLANLGLKSVLGGSLAAFMTAAVAGILI